MKKRLNFAKNQVINLWDERENFVRIKLQQYDKMSKFNESKIVKLGEKKLKLSEIKVVILFLKKSEFYNKSSHIFMRKTEKNYETKVVILWKKVKISREK